MAIGLSPSLFQAKCCWLIFTCPAFCAKDYWIILGILCTLSRSLLVFSRRHAFYADCTLFFLHIFCVKRPFKLCSLFLLSQHLSLRHVQVLNSTDCFWLCKWPCEWMRYQLFPNVCNHSRRARRQYTVILVEGKLSISITVVHHAMKFKINHDQLWFSSSTITIWNLCVAENMPIPGQSTSTRQLVHHFQTNMSLPGAQCQHLHSHKRLMKTKRMATHMEKHGHNKVSARKDRIHTKEMRPVCPWSPTFSTSCFCAAQQSIKQNHIHNNSDSAIPCD